MPKGGTQKKTQLHAPRKKSEVKRFSWETNYVAGIILANCGLQNLSWEFIVANCCISFPLLHLFVGVDSTQKCSFSWRLFVWESTDEMPGQALSEWTCHAACRLACRVHIHSRRVVVLWVFPHSGQFSGMNRVLYTLEKQRDLCWEAGSPQG